MDIAEMLKSGTKFVGGMRVMGGGERDKHVELDIKAAQEIVRADEERKAKAGKPSDLQNKANKQMA